MHHQKRRLAPLALAVAALMLVLWACQQTPYTGRRQLQLLTYSQEAQLGLQAYQETLAGVQLSTNQAWTDMLQRCGNRIAAAVDDPAFRREVGLDPGLVFNWEFKLVADPTVNAFCLPGGKIAFYEGIMPVCGDETGVAVVMGHEVAHAIARHGNERVSHAMVAQLGTETAADLLGATDPDTRQLIAAGLGIGLNVGVMLPFSREHESEADHIGLVLMAWAGYDPRAAPDFWRRMQQLSGGARAPEFLSTHPHPETRVQQLESWIPEALPYYRR